MSERFARVARPDADSRTKFDIQLGAARDDEDRLAARLQNSSIELKTEFHDWDRTGNLFIEYFNRGQPSGIDATAADYWFHELLDRDGQTAAYIVVPTERLRRIVHDWKGTPADVCGGDGKLSRGIKLKLTNILYEIGRKR
jgi:hypothetical protein